MKHHNHATRNSIIIFAAIALIIVGGLYFWHNGKDVHCTKVCTTNIDEEITCADICAPK